MGNFIVWIMMFVLAFCPLIAIWCSRTRSRALTSLVLIVIIIDVVALLFYVMKF